MEGRMNNVFSCVKNTRKSYSIFYKKSFIEVEVQFGEEDPAWIPLDTLVAMEKRR